MLINTQYNSWVMLQGPEGFVRLPNEHQLFASPPRTTLSLQPLGSSASKDSFSMQSSAGRVYLTNQRVLSCFWTLSSDSSR